MSAAWLDRRPTISDDYVQFLQWALPRLGMRWRGFRKPRRQVIRHLKKRLGELGLSLSEYREHLERDAAEWDLLDSFCRVTISRFYRNRGVFDGVREVLLPNLARAARDRGDRHLRVWCVGCASGEEPYTLAMIWRQDLEPTCDLELDILATDVQPHLLARARRARYPLSALIDLPKELRERFFCPAGELERDLKTELLPAIRFERHDVRGEPPPGPFHLISCRHLVFTYYLPELQQQVLTHLMTRLIRPGALLLGSHEAPIECDELSAHPTVRGAFLFDETRKHRQANSDDSLKSRPIKNGKS